MTDPEPHAPFPELATAIGLPSDAGGRRVADRLREIARLQGPARDTAPWTALSHVLTERLRQPLHQQPRDMGHFAYFIGERTMDAVEAAGLRGDLAQEIGCDVTDDLAEWIVMYVTTELGPVLFDAGAIRALPYPD